MQPRQVVRLSPSQILTSIGQEDIDYQLNAAPFTRYWWTGTAFETVSGGAGGGVTYATAAEIAALAATSDLTAGGIYFDSATGTHYLASSTTEYAPLSASAHLGTVTLDTALTYPTPTTGLTADVTDILPSAEPIRIRYNGTAWKAQRAARNRTRVTPAAFVGATYATTGRWALPEGAVSLFSAIEVKVKLELSTSPDTDTLTSWRVKLGTAGTAADATIVAPTGTPLSAGDNQRGYNVDFTLESATSIRCDAVTNTTSVGWSGSTAVANAADAAVTIPDTLASALYLGVDYTQGVASNGVTVSAIYTLHP